MRFPNKVIPFRKSILAKFSMVLDAISKQDMSILDLYEKNKNKFDGITEYVDVLDCLFFLGKIELLNGGVILHYVERDTM